MRPVFRFLVLALSLALVLPLGAQAAKPVIPFSDVSDSAWYAPEVRDVQTRALMDGVGNHRFQPEGTLTRAMTVTVLWRLAGQPVCNAILPFRDVPAETWYTEAVRWAVGTDVTNGTSATTFSPNAPVSRQELAVFFYRWAKDHNYDVTVTQPLATIGTDLPASWAATEMAWAFQHRLLVRGSLADTPNWVTPSFLLPTKSATRAEVAVCLSRFCRLFPVEETSPAATPAALTTDLSNGKGMLVLTTPDPARTGVRVIRLWTDLEMRENNPQFRNETTPYSPAAPAQNLTYGKNEAGQVTQVRDAAGNPLVTLTYNDQGQLVRLEDTSYAVSAVYATYELTYDRYGNLAFVQLDTDKLNSKTLYTFHYTQANGAWVLTDLTIDQNTPIGF